MMKITGVVLLLFTLLWPGAAVGRELRLRLDEVVTQALEGNLGLKIQRREVEAARAGLEAERGYFDPLVKADAFENRSEQINFFAPGVTVDKTTYWSASVARVFEPGTMVDLTWEAQRYKSDSLLLTTNPVFSSGFSVGVSQPLLKGLGSGVQTAGVVAADRSAAAVEETYSAEALDLAALVSRTYWELLFARQDLEVKHRSLELAGKFLENARGKIEAGTLAPVAVHQPESEVARREEALIAGERSVAAMEDSLKLLLNLAEWSDRIIPVDLPRVDPVHSELVEVVKNSLAARPEIKAADLAVEAAELLADRAADQLRSQLDISGRVGFTGIDDGYGSALDGLVSDGSPDWQVGVSFAMPLGNRSAKGGLRAARAGVEQARDSLELIKQRVLKDARGAVRDERLALKGIEASRKTVEAVKKRLEAEDKQFEVGMSTALDVLEAQNAYARALVGQKRAMIDYAIARVELSRVQGRLPVALNEDLGVPGE